jgi:hypothetical protein
VGVEKSAGEREHRSHRLDPFRVSRWVASLSHVC